MLLELMPSVYAAIISLSLYNLMQLSKILIKTINGKIVTIVLGIMFIESKKTLKTGILFTTIKFNNLVVCNNHDIPIHIKNIRKKDFKI